MRCLPPAEDVVEEEYQLTTLKAPVLRGWRLRAFGWFLRTPLGAAVQATLRRNSGVTQVTKELSLPEKPTYTPTAFFEPVRAADDVLLEGRDPSETVSKVLSLLPERTREHWEPRSVRDYVDAYTSGKVTPAQVCENIVRFVQGSGELHWFTSFNADEVLQEGRASAERYTSGATLSPIDGVPFCVKDTLHAVNHQTTCGTAHISISVDSQHPEASIVSILKQLGAILLGKTNMHEIGLGVTGLNVIHGTAANPWDRDVYPGGSSSAGAAVVAAGLCPLSIGSDGGGSIRVPASFCGVFGLKLTHGREVPQCSIPLDYTVCCYGPLTNCVEDSMLLYSLLSKRPKSRTDKTAIPLLLPALRQTERPLTSLKFGVYWEWFNHSLDEVKDKCKSALDLIERLGGEILEVCIPELELLRVAHTVTIVSEMLQVMHRFFANAKTRRGMNLDAATNLTVATGLRAFEYIQAQCMRTRMGIHFKRAFQTVDCLMMPTTPVSAPRIHPKARTAGESNLAMTSLINRFMPAVNFLGMPAASVPVGFDSKGLPIGLQVMGKHWQESLLLKVCYHIEQKLKGSAADDSRPNRQISRDPLDAKQ